jgi:hypothetical protein
VEKKAVFDGALGTHGTLPTLVAIVNGEKVVFDGALGTLGTLVVIGNRKLKGLYAFFFF